MRLVDYRASGALQQTPTRYGFGDGLVEAGRRDPNVVAVCADLTASTRMEAFSKEFPDRFIEIGVQEQLLAAMSAGLAMARCRSLPPTRCSARDERGNRCAPISASTMRT